VNDDLHPVVMGFVIAVSVATGVYGLWCTVVAFVGGTIPILGWEVDGGLVPGLLCLVFGVPLIIALGYLLAMLVALVLNAFIRSKRSVN
jgi:hypothetical protein